MKNASSPAAPTAPSCAICEAAPGVIDALWDDQPVRVCAPGFEFETEEAS